MRRLLSHTPRVLPAGRERLTPLVPRARIARMDLRSRLFTCAFSRIVRTLIFGIMYSAA